MSHEIDQETAIDIISALRYYLQEHEDRLNMTSYGPKRECPCLCCKATRRTLAKLAAPAPSPPAPQQGMGSAQSPAPSPISGIEPFAVCNNCRKSWPVALIDRNLCANCRIDGLIADRDDTGRMCADNAEEASKLRRERDSLVNCCVFGSDTCKGSWEYRCGTRSGVVSSKARAEYCVRMIAASR